MTIRSCFVVPAMEPHQYKHAQVLPLLGAFLFVDKYRCNRQYVGVRRVVVESYAKGEKEAFEAHKSRMRASDLV